MIKAEIVIAGKKHQVEVIGGDRYIDEKTIDEFVQTLTILELKDLVDVGLQALKDEKHGTKPRKYQQMMKCAHIRRNN